MLLPERREWGKVLAWIAVVLAMGAFWLGVSVLIVWLLS